jgi:hypothetical protein
MEITSYSGTKYPSVSIPKLVQARYTSGRVTMPVKPNQYVYARMKNVAVVPAGGDDSGYSLARLRAIDTLIGRLKQLKGENGFSGDYSVKDIKEPPRIDALIQELSDKLHTEALKAEQVPYKGVSAGSLLGMVVDLTL